VEVEEHQLLLGLFTLVAVAVDMAITKQPT
jgi:hypothetical protein